LKARPRFTMASSRFCAAAEGYWKVFIISGHRRLWTVVPISKPSFSFDTA
jgi:hypothetical protein